MSKVRKRMPPATTRIPDKKKEIDKSYCRTKIEPNSQEYCELRSEMIKKHAKLYHPCEFCGGPTTMTSQPCCPHCKKRNYGRGG